MADLTPIQAVRYVGDVEGERALLEDDDLRPLIDRANELITREGVRKRILSSAVRIDEDILPTLHEAISQICARARIDREVECFVSECPSIQAAVINLNERVIIILGSAAIERLAREELEFVIGHELGHVAYDHMQIPVNYLIRYEDDLTPKQKFRLMSWSRQCEISADRAGLVCCNSLDAAANAYFKTESGLSIAGLQVNALRLANQFDHLRDVLWQEGSEDLAMLTHPLGPLRMKALILFWRNEAAKKYIPAAAGGTSSESCDKEIGHLLSFMDPMAVRGDLAVDPLLVPYLLWGGLYIAAANSKIVKSEIETLVDVVGESNVHKALEGGKSKKLFREKFAEAVKNRTRPLSAIDVHKIFEAMILVAAADGKLDLEERTALHDLASIMGISTAYVDGLLDEVDLG